MDVIYILPTDGCTYVLVVLLLILITILYPRRRKGVPDGPILFPVLGNLPSLASKDPLKSFTDLWKKYGDVYGIYIGGELTVFINGYDAIHDALVKRGNVFSKRPRGDFHQITFKDPGIVFANGAIWKQHRQFSQAALNEFGYGWTEKTLEERINDELYHFLNTIESYDEPFDISGLMTLSVANVIAGILFGKRCEYTDERFVACIHSVGEAAKLFSHSSVLMSVFPWLIYIPGDFLGLGKIEKIREKPKQFLQHVFSWHSEFCKGKETRDILGLYRQEIDKGCNGQSSLFNETTMRALMGELLSAGSETTATCIIWIILYLILNPDLQTRLQNNIDEVVGMDRRPSLNDRQHLPLVEAVILEGLRIRPIAPLSVPHAVHEDVNFRGYLIPAETTVLVNLHSVLKDPQTFPEPDVFNPERFLDETGHVIIPKQFIPFSTGRRSCLGESLARMELFLCVTSLLQRFTMTSPLGSPPPSTEGVLGMTFCPKPFKMVAIPRTCDK
ncbi:cytochrome P450 2D4-like [Mya arenaria]|uniref:cytochrome P450 2D4-like n=1 Tax=Mya arenaria TaxID=6604 RepID=UPI0022E939AF|nr:cytochrome P450 2D4-like [Mya arenaria]